SRAVACVNTSPAGDGKMMVGVSAAPESWSSTSPQGSGFMTMPAPPPYGVSSTVRCRSCVQSRRSWTFRSRRPVSRALPSSDSVSPSKYDGKIETTSTRMVRGFSVGARSGKLLEKPGRRSDDHAPSGDVDRRHDGRHEGDHDLGVF